MKEKLQVLNPTIMITLSEENLKELELFFQDMPTKYGMALLQYFGKLAEEQNPKKEEKK